MVVELRVPDGKAQDAENTADCLVVVLGSTSLLVPLRAVLQVRDLQACWRQSCQPMHEQHGMLSATRRNPE